MQQIVVVQFAHSLGREARKICESRIALAAVFPAFCPPGYGPLEIFVFDDTELRAPAMPLGRRQRAVTEPFQADDAIARGELRLAGSTPATVPTGTAFFNASNTTALSFSANATVGGWTFNAEASAYTFARCIGLLSVIATSP